VNEKVYTVSMVGLALVSWMIVRWCDDPDAPGADKLLVLAAYLMGLGYANHMAGILALPAMAIAVIVRRPRMFMRGRLILACAGALVLGVTPFATQPIRASHFPAINEGEVTACTTEISASCLFTAKTYERFKYNFDREQYGKGSVLDRQAPLPAQFGMWWLYFKWQWMRDLAGEQTSLQNTLALLFFSLGLAGAWVHYRRDRTSFAYFAPFMVTITVVLIYYLNFKYGASQTTAAFCDSSDPSPCEVRDRDYFFLWSFSAWGVWAALGLMWVWEAGARILSTDPKHRGPAVAPKRFGWALASPLIALAFVPLIANWNVASRKGDTDTADWARDLLNSVEPYGILVTVGDNDMFPLWYAQEVEGVRRDVVIANTSLMNTQWFVRQMIRRPIFEYDADTGPVLYRGKQWPKPAKPVLAMSFDEADSIPDYSEVAQTMEFVSGDLRAEVTPRILMRSDFLVYKLIQENPDRPFHFARTTGSYADRLGFREAVATHGLTRKLSRTALTETDTMIRLPGAGGEWVDIAATHTLWNEFDAPASLIAKNKWVDPSSVSIPMVYVRLGVTLGDSMILRGDTASANAVLARATGIAEAVGFRRVSQPAPTPSLPLGDTAPSARPLPPGR
jgi:hypothetical protein